MTFAIPAHSYARFMGRWSEPLADLLLEQVDRDGARPGGPVLDVGCGPGVLTARLVDRLGLAQVAAIDPSPPFVAATRDRFPGLDVREGSAEDLPWPDDTFASALAQLVVHFMSDPVAGLGQMRRVTRPGGLVAAAVWDHAGRRSPLTTFWDAVHLTDPDVDDQSDLPGAREGSLPALLTEAGAGRRPVRRAHGRGPLRVLRGLVAAPRAGRRPPARARRVADARGSHRPPGALPHLVAGGPVRAHGHGVVRLRQVLSTCAERAR